MHEENCLVVVQFTPGNLIFSGVIGVFSSLCDATNGIQHYEQESQKVNPHFKPCPTWVPEEKGDRWLVSGGQYSYWISEHKSDVVSLKPINPYAPGYTLRE